MSYDPKLKSDLALIMGTLGALCLDAADIYSVETGESEAVSKDRATHKMQALRDYDRELSQRSELRMQEAMLESVRPTNPQVGH